MRIEDRIKQAALRWADSGAFIDRLRMEALVLVWRVFAPSAGLGFMLGGIATAGMMWFAAPLLEDMPFVAAVLIATEIGGLAWIWQILYDKYWRGE